VYWQAFAGINFYSSQAKTRSKSHTHTHALHIYTHMYAACV